MKHNANNSPYLPAETAKMFQYNVIIIPDKSVLDGINLIKQKLNHFIRPSSENLYSQAYISILDMEHDDEDLVMGKLINVLANQDRFPIIIDGADFHFQDGNSTLYIPIKNPVPIQVLNNLLNIEFGYQVQTFLPHLNIAKGISIEDYKIVSRFVAEFAYQGEFLCESVTIIKRPADNHNGHWETAAKISFG